MADDVDVRPRTRTSGGLWRPGRFPADLDRFRHHARRIQHMPSLRPFSFLFGSNKEDVISEYVIREHHRGRALDEILKDPHVTNTLSAQKINALLDRPEIVHAVGEDLIAAHRSA
jgi:hypothetical protein